MHRRENGLHLSYCNRERPPHKREKKGPFQPPTAMTIPFPSCERACRRPCKQSRLAFRCRMLTFMEIRPLVIIERVSRKLPSSLTTYYFERANHHPRDETTEPKNANAETGQHLFFFPSSDTTAALHFFFVKRQEMLRFSNA